MAVALCAQIPTACQKPQGNAELNLSGLPFLGNTINLVLDATTDRPFILAADLPPTPPTVHATKFPWGTICLGPRLMPVASGQILTGTGQFPYPITIPNITSLQGFRADFQSVVADPTRFLAISNLERLTVGGTSPVKTIFFDDFEIVRSPPSWFATNGLWQVGKLTNAKVGPPSCFSGARCAGTDLPNQYPHSGADTRFESPLIALPELDSKQPNQQIRVNYRMWFDTEDAYDYCTLLVSKDRGRTWNSVAGSPAISGSNRAWTQLSADLSSYAGEHILLGFRFVSRRSCPYSNCVIAGDGVYIDDVHVFAGTPVFEKTETWEQGIGFWWHSDNGLWQVGSPAVGPKLPSPSNPGKQCVGTLLSANYPHAASDTRLISPPVTLPPANSTVRNLIFKMWMDTEKTYDFGDVQVSTDGGKTWLTLPQTTVSGQSKTWTSKRVPLIDNTAAKVAIQGKTILIAFRFVSGRSCPYSNCVIAGNGWYLDDVLIQ